MYKKIFSIAVVAAASLTLFAATADAQRRIRPKQIVIVPPKPAVSPPPRRPPVPAPMPKPALYQLDGLVTVKGSGEFQQQTAACKWTITRRYTAQAILQENARAFNVPKLPDQLYGISMAQVQRSIADQAGHSWTTHMTNTPLLDGQLAEFEIDETVVCKEPGLGNHWLPSTSTITIKKKGDYFYGNAGGVSINNNDGKVSIQLGFGTGGPCVKTFSKIVHGGESPKDIVSTEACPGVPQISGYIGGDAKFSGPMGFLAMPEAGFVIEKPVPFVRGTFGWDGLGTGDVDFVVRYSFRKK